VADPQALLNLSGRGFLVLQWGPEPGPGGADGGARRTPNGEQGPLDL